MTERKLLIEQLRHEEIMHQKSGSKALANLFASAAREIDSLGEDRDSWRRVSERLESENIDLRAENEELRAARLSYANLFDGDMGSIHENIRKLKAENESSNREQQIKTLEALSGFAWECGMKGQAGDVVWLSDIQDAVNKLRQGDE